MKTYCIYCSKALSGRSDKKFCDVHCKNAYNNNRIKEQHSYLRRMNKQVMCNFFILKELYENKYVHVHRNVLKTKGFYFERCTEIRILDDAGIVYYCFGLGIKPLENDYFALTTID